MVTGLLLITIILSPLFQVFNQDFDQILKNMDTKGYANAEEMKNEIDFKKKEIQASQHAYILEEMAVQLEESVKEELMTQYNLEIQEIVVDAPYIENSTKNPKVQSVFISLRQAESQEEDGIEAVEVVQIDTTKSIHDNSSPSKEEETITTLLSEKWSLDPKAIKVEIERGNEG